MNHIGEWKSVIMLFIGALLAAVAGLAPKADPMLMNVAIMIIGGALGLSVPGAPQRDPHNRTRITDEQQPPERGSSGR